MKGFFPGISMPIFHGNVGASDVWLVRKSKTVSLFGPLVRLWNISHFTSSYNPGIAGLAVFAAPAWKRFATPIGLIGKYYI